MLYTSTLSALMIALVIYFTAVNDEEGPSTSEQCTSSTVQTGGWIFYKKCSLLV